MDVSGQWTLDQLTEQVEVALAVDYAGAPSGRVRSVPDRRAIRWYTTIGLVDRPAAMRGRTALYGERHLLQLVAIKRRQADGRSLAEIQTELAGATDPLLRSIAQLPNGTPTTPRAPDTPRADRFWSAPTADPDPTAKSTAATPSAHAPATAVTTADPPAAGPSAHTTADPPAAGEQSAHAAGASGGAPAPAVPRPDPRAEVPTVSPAYPSGEPARGHDGAGRRGGGEANDRGSGPAGMAVAPAIRLPGGIALLLPAGTPYPTDDDLLAIRTAATQLLAELNRRGLTDTDSTKG